MVASAILAQGAQVDINLTLPGILALGAGVLILIFPKVLNYIVAAYLIAIGLVLIFDVTI